MKRSLAAALIALPLMAGCVTSNSNDKAQSEAYARCSYTPGPKERAACIKTELALIEARERQAADRLEDARDAPAGTPDAMPESPSVPSQAAQRDRDPGLQPE